MEEINKIKAALSRLGAKIAAATPEARQTQVDAIWSTLRKKGIEPGAGDILLGDQYINGAITLDALSYELYNRFGSAL